MSGKILTLLLLLIILAHTSHQNAKFKQAEIRGGLLFEKEVEKPVIVNPNYIAYKRKLILTDIFKAVDLTRQFTYEYKNFCDTVQSTATSDMELRYHAYKYKYEIIPGLQQLFYGRTECAKIKKRTPEIRTQQDLKDLRAYMKHTKITMVDIGLTWNGVEGRLKYDRDGTILPSFISTTRIYGMRTKYELTGVYDNYAIVEYNKSQNKRVYLTFHNETPVIAPFGDKENIESLYSNIICDKGDNTIVARSNGFLLDIASHLCARDYENIAGMTAIVSQEASLFRSSSLEPEPKDIDPSIANECPSLTNYDGKIVVGLKNMIRTVASQLSTDVNLPKGITTRFVLFRALALTTQQEFKQFLLSDVTRTYLHHNPTQVLLNSLACQFDIEYRTKPKEQAQYVYKELFNYGPIDNLDPIIHTVNTLTSPLSMIKTRNKRSVLVEIQEKLTPKTGIFNMNSVSYWLGIATVSNLENMMGHIGINALAITHLAINQKEIKQAYESLRREIELLQNVTRQSDFATASLIAVLDNKATINNLHNVIRQSLIIISTALNAGYLGKPSPYVLSEGELDHLAREARNKNIFLSNSLEDIQTTVVKYKNEYTFLFLVPVIDNRYLYRLLHVRNFPIFIHNNTTQSVTPDAEYIGISIDLTNYIELTEAEYAECTKSTFCSVATVGGKITENSRCVAQTFKHKEQTCEMNYTNDSIPFFATYGNQTLFSTPIDYQGELLCPKSDARTEGEPLTGKLNFSGVGMIHIRPGCTVELQDGRILSPHYHTNLAFDLGAATVNQAFQYLPNTETYKFKINDSLAVQFNKIEPIELEEVHLNTLQYFIKASVSYESMIPHLIRAGIIIAALLVVFGLCYAFIPQFRAWIKACCFSNNPKKFWDKKGYHVPTFERIVVRGKGIQIGRKLKAMKRKSKSKTLQQTDIELTPSEVELQDMLAHKKAKCEAIYRKPLQMPTDLRTLEEPEQLPQFEPHDMQPPPIYHVTGPTATHLTHELNRKLYP